MGLDDGASHYEILDLRPDATPQEVREAYLRAKSTYTRDSVALYTLISPEEREDMLRRVEEAHAVLSSPERRREYDRHYGGLETSILPAADDREEPDALLIPPATDAGDSRPPGSGGFDAPEDNPFFSPTPSTSLPASPSPSLAPTPTSAPSAARAPAARPPASAPPEVSAQMAQEIAQETEWRGAFLRRVREARHITIEEMSGITKVSKAYLAALEEEDAAKLPAAVFVRGFVSQVARVLKLPQAPVVTAYMARFSQAKASPLR
jgi:hypothetical protein